LLKQEISIWEEIESLQNKINNLKIDAKQLGIKTEAFDELASQWD
jgi:SMC interacting uncharacterized protein involved in chromosome segregation